VRHPGESRDLGTRIHWKRKLPEGNFAAMKGGWVYIMTNKPGGVLYIGVAADLAARVAQHREGAGSKFCRKYNLRRLVLAEPYPTIDEAIAREKAMKEWHRLWKIELIEAGNPGWDDLWEVING
jgi:putative endonuclease